MEFKVFHLFAGLGGGALGFKRARAEWCGLSGRFRTLGGVDVDADACRDFERLVGVGATRLDLFSRDQYRDFHGKEPPEDWREAGAEDLRAAAGGERPDVVFGSPPCKSYSALLPKQQAVSRRYLALSGLTLRGIRLVLEAWADDLPGLILLENVPRITTRGAAFLREIRSMLNRRGYGVHEGHHDLGELGGLAQHRRRYLLVARRESKVASLLYRPPKLKVRAIGNVLGKLPMPDDEAGGPLHRLPRLTWITWLRLALIPAGGDWRDLQRVEPGSFGLEPVHSVHYNHVARVTDWGAAAGTVTGGHGPMQGATCVADPRLPGTHWDGHMRVVQWGEAAPTVTGQAGNFGSNSAAAVADVRIAHEPRPGTYRVGKWEAPATAVVGHADVRGSNGMAAVADPRRSSGRCGVMEWSKPAGTVTGTMRPSCGTVPATVADPRLRHLPREGSLKVVRWAEPSTTVVGSAAVTASNGAAAVADPRLPDSQGRHLSKFRVEAWSEPAVTVTGSDRVGSGAQCVGDPRLGCAPRNGAYGVLAWDRAAGAVTGAGDVHAQGAAAVADPRLPEAGARGVWVLISEDGTWHRPLTTWELAALQGLPVFLDDGHPLVLAGKSQARWRERIGNAVPPPAAEAVAESMLRTLLPSAVGTWALSRYGTAVWVRAILERFAQVQARRGAPRRA